MTEQFKIGAEFQKVSKDTFEAAVRAYSEANKGFEAIAAEVAAYFKKAFEDATTTFEKLAGAKSVEQAIEIQSQYATKAYEDYVAQVRKLSDLYLSLARTSYGPIEKAVSVAKKTA